MHTNIRPVDISCHVLEVTASKRDLEDDVNRAVKELKAQVSLKGFRPGRIPNDLLKRIYRDKLTKSVSHSFVEEVFNDLVKDTGEYVLRFEPSYDILDYRLDDDLRAEVTFNVLPDIDIEPLSEITLEWYSYVVTEEDLDNEILKIQRISADQRYLENSHTLEEGDTIRCMVTELDPATRAVLIGRGEPEDIELRIGEPNDELEEALNTAAPGCEVGSPIIFQMGEGTPGSLIQTSPAAQNAPKGGSSLQLFSAEIYEAYREELPELDDDFVEDVTSGERDSVAGLRAFLGEELQKKYDDVIARHNVYGLRSRMLSLFPIKISHTMLDLLATETGLPQPVVEAEMQWEILREAFETKIEDGKSDDSGSEGEEEVEMDYNQRENRVMSFLKSQMTVQEQEFDPSILANIPEV